MAEKKKPKNTAELVETLCRRVIEDAGYFLWDVDFYKEGADYNLLVTIENKDRSRPIDLNDCEKVTRLINPILDEADPIEESYYLEVSSAGLERELKRPEHFAAFLGEKAEVRLFAPQNGKKVFRGILQSYENQTLSLKMENGEILTAQREKIAKVTTVAPDFE